MSRPFGEVRKHKLALPAYWKGEHMNNEGMTRSALRMVAVPVAALVMLSAASANAGETRVVASATGGYQATYSGRTRSIEFAATRDANNNVRGQVQFNNLDTGAILHYEVTCLHIDGNVATMTGPIKMDSTAGLPYFWLRVVDNGQGRLATDFVSPFVTFDEDVGCFEDVRPPGIPIDNGNIQVR